MFGGFKSQLGSNSIELPLGGATAASPFVCKNLGDCYAFKACICRTASLKAHGEMKAHILATICLHVVGKQGGRLS